MMKINNYKEPSRQSVFCRPPASHPLSERVFLPFGQLQGVKPDELKPDRSTTTAVERQDGLVMKPDVLNVGHKCNLNISSMARMRMGYVNSFVTSTYPTQCHSPSTALAAIGFSSLYFDF